MSQTGIRGEKEENVKKKWEQVEEGNSRGGNTTKYALPLERAKKCVMIYDYTSLIDYYSVLQRV